MIKEKLIQLGLFAANPPILNNQSLFVNFPTLYGENISLATIAILQKNVTFSQNYIESRTNRVITIAIDSLN